MKIAYIMNMSGGIQGFVYREMEYMRKAGTEFCIYYTKYGSGPYMPNEEYAVLNHNYLNLFMSQIFLMINKPKLFFQLISISIQSHTFPQFLLSVYFSEHMRKIEIDRIHCTFGGDKLLIGYYCKRILGLRLSVVVHAYEIEDSFTDSTDPKYQFSKIAYRYCDKIVTISNWNKKKMIEKFALPAKDIKVIRLCSLMNKGNTKVSSSLSNIAEKDLSFFKILIVGNSFERKGHEILFQAIHRLNSDKVKLWIVSQGGPIDLRKRIEEMQLENKVRFFGSVSHQQLIEIYKNCDIYCLPAFLTDDGDHEGIPVSIMDAMAFSKPVISTKHTGIPELVEEILLEERDVDGLSDAIVRLMNDRSLCKRMGKRNHQIISEKYSETNIQRFMEEIIDV